jgi:hypothetical protein
MAFTVTDVFEEARDQHLAFDDIRSPGLPAFRALARMQERLLRKAAEIDPKRFECLHEIDLTTFDFDLGTTLPEGLVYYGRRVENTNPVREQEFSLVHPDERTRPSVWPSGYIIETDTLCLIGDADDWSDFDKLKIGYVKFPTELVDKDSVLDALPNYARDVYVAELALLFAKRMQGRTGAPPVDQFFAAKREAVAEFLTTVASQKVAEVSTIRPVW